MPAQVRDQITTEIWERLNILYLRTTSGYAERAFDANAPAFLSEAISDLHLFKGATDATMSHGEGWRFMLIGVHIERAQLIGKLLKVCFQDGQSIDDDHTAMVSLLRMACALEPYLRAYTRRPQRRLHPAIPAVRRGVSPFHPVLHLQDRKPSGTPHPGPRPRSGAIPGG